jgi:hypothetical protein
LNILLLLVEAEVGVLKVAVEVQVVIEQGRHQYHFLLVFIQSLLAVVEEVALV